MLALGDGNDGAVNEHDTMVVVGNLGASLAEHLAAIGQLGSGHPAAPAFAPAAVLSWSFSMCTPPVAIHIETPISLYRADTLCVLAGTHFHLV